MALNGNLINICLQRFGQTGKELWIIFKGVFCGSLLKIVYTASFGSYL